MNTHSVDLSMDLAAISTLATDTGFPIPGLSAVASFLTCYQRSFMHIGLAINITGIVASFMFSIVSVKNTTCFEDGCQKHE
jgi:hypothetical protein